ATNSRLPAGHSQPRNCILAPGGSGFGGHEFHRSQVTTPPSQPVYSLKRYQAQMPHASEGWHSQQVHASYLHLHWGGCPEVARNFVAACERYRQPPPE
ncbi:MAG: cobyrinate a,c-diamide synthase, partial [Leptolyngbyaceae cyanobacterium SM2_5_2]|nr:cobyrinate a,c-diamide synthase [Leptolyngbyaceae cyanobacterium SM2_5_2]